MGAIGQIVLMRRKKLNPAVSRSSVSPKPFRAAKLYDGNPRDYIWVEFEDERNGTNSAHAP